MHSASAIHGQSIYRDTARKEETRLGAYIYIYIIKSSPGRGSKRRVSCMIWVHRLRRTFFTNFSCRGFGGLLLFCIFLPPLFCFQMILWFDGNCIISGELWV